MGILKLQNRPLLGTADAAREFGTGVRGSDMYRLYDDFRLAGGNFFDSAHCYCFWLENGMGASEKALGECLRRSGDRKQVIIGTKGGHPASMPKYPRPDAYLAPEVIASDIQDSLERLGVDQIDLYFLHRDDSRVPVAEIMDALNAEVVTRGRIRCLGASNWATSRIEEANAYAAKHSLVGFVASQTQWNLAHPNPPADSTMKFISLDDELWHTRHQLPVVAYSPTPPKSTPTGGRTWRNAQPDFPRMANGSTISGDPHPWHD